MSELPTAPGTPKAEAQADSGVAWFAILLLLTAPLMMAANGIIGRAAVETVPPVALAFWRWTISFFILLPWTGRSLLQHARLLRQNLWTLLLLGALGMGVSGAVVYIGLVHTTATNTTIIYAFSPVMILLLSSAVDRRPIAPRQVLGVVLAIAGVMTIISRGRWQTIAGIEFNIGDLCILAAAIGWAVYSVVIRRFNGQMPTFTLFSAVILAGMVVVAPFYALETALGAPMVFDQRTLISIVAVALICSVFAFSAFQKAIAVVGAARAGASMYLIPAYGVVLAVLFLGEQFRAFHAAGLALLLPGVALASLKPPTSLKPRKG